MAFLDEIATYLATEASLTVGTTLYKGRMPEDPDDQVALFEYGGEPPVIGLGDTGGVQFENPAVQVVVRDTSYTDARTLAETCYNSMAKIQGDTLSSTEYHVCRPLQSPFFLGRDEKGRPMIACNYICPKERT